MRRKKQFLIFVFSCLVSAQLFAQTSDDQFRKPLRQVLDEVQKRFGIAIRYPEDLIKDKWVTYADWRYKPDAEKTLAALLASQDLNFAKEGDKKYKLQAFQYHLKTVEEGKEQLAYLSSLYNDKTSWEKRKAELKQCILSSLKLTRLPAKPASQPIL